MPLAKEKVFSGRLVAWHGAFSRRRIQRGNQGGESIQRVGRQIERRHTCRWNPVLDQAAQLLSRSFAHPGVSSKPWALLRTMGIGSMAAGAKLRVHLLGVHLGRRGWRILRAQPELAQYERATSILARSMPYRESSDVLGFPQVSLVIRSKPPGVRKSNGLHPDRKRRVLADVTNVRIGIGDCLGPIEDPIALVQLMRNPRRMLPINRERSQRRCARPVPAKADDDVIKIFQRVLRAPHCLCCRSVDSRRGYV